MKSFNDQSRPATGEGVATASILALIVAMALSLAVNTEPSPAGVKSQVAQAQVKHYG